MEAPVRPTVVITTSAPAQSPCIVLGSAASIFTKRYFPLHSGICVSLLAAATTSCSPDAQRHFNISAPKWPKAPARTTFIWNTFLSATPLLPHFSTNYLLRLLFLCFYGRKLDNWNEKKIERLVTYFAHMCSFYLLLINVCRTGRAKSVF